MSVPYLLMARYRAISQKNNYIVLLFQAYLESSSFTSADAIASTALLISENEVISSYTDARLVDIVILPIKGENISETDGEGNIRLWEILKISADGEIKSESAEFLRTFTANPIESNVFIKSKIEETINILNVLLINSGVEHESDSEATANAFCSLLINADNVNINSESSKSVLYALKIQPIYAEDVEIKTDVSAIAHSYKLIAIPVSSADSDTYFDAVTRVFQAVSIYGESEENAFDFANLKTLPVLNLDIVSSEYSETIANVKKFSALLIESLSESDSENIADIGLYEAKSCESDSESKIETMANMKLWVLPVVWGDTLLLFQAANVKQIGNTLEVT